MYNVLLVTQLPQQYSSAPTSLNQPAKPSSPATGSFCRLPGGPEERRSPPPNQGHPTRGRREMEEEKEEKEQKKEKAEKAKEAKEEEKG